MNVLRLGLVGYQDARIRQEELVRERIASRISDTLLVLEHPPTITLGRRSHRSAAAFAGLAGGVGVIAVTRGGEATYHGPGQLVLYPVVFLRERKLSVREFVRLGLDAIASVARDFGVAAEAKLEPAGVWIHGTERKLASVGLRIEHAVTNHGFAFNIDCDLGVFSRFPVCGRPETRATSLRAEAGEVSVPDVRERTIDAFLAAMR